MNQKSLGNAVRRCSILLVELKEEAMFDLESLLTGGAGLRREKKLVAIAPHLDDVVEVTSDELEVLMSFSPTEWLSWDGSDTSRALHVTHLLEQGLLVRSNDSRLEVEERDEKIRKAHWWPLAAVFHRQARWMGVNGVKAMEESGLVTAEGLCEKFGPPPVHVADVGNAENRISLTREEGNSFDALLARRTTCRNFDCNKPLDWSLFCHMLERVFSAQAIVQPREDAVFLKKTSPSGGGLHATEAYLLVQNVEGVDPGLYHYHPISHALEPIDLAMDGLKELALRALAGQHWFADAPVLVVLTPRYGRSFWKYRHHAKAYRALILDSGHLSQTLYLSATDLGLGAFVTSAINEVDIEEAFGLDPLVEGPLAICGFGYRADTMTTTEFDPAHEVWEPMERLTS